MTDNEDFKCIHCGKSVVASGNIGTKNRNHCPYCLCSKDVDDKVAGDRQATCHGQMRAVGLTFKKEGVDKYGKDRQGELMLIHACTKCHKISINRIAGDDNTTEIMKLTDSDKLNDEIRSKIESQGVEILSDKDHGAIKIQLFGKD